MLKKGVSFWGVFSIASGAMISSGIFILPGLAFSKAGPAVFLSYLLAGILGLVGVLSVIELSTAMPKAGGDYYFINKAFGPLFGTISGFLGWFALSLKSAFAIFGITKIIFLYTGVDMILSGFILCTFFVILNIVGVKEAAIFQLIMVFGLISIMVLYIMIGIPKVDYTHFTPFLTSDVSSIIITSGFIFISFGGLLKVATISEEVIDPKRNIPYGMISSVICVTILYTLTTFIITGTLDPEVFRDSLTPVADSAKIIIGNVGYVSILIASTLAFFTTANAGIMSASRYPLALSRDHLLPPQIAVINKKFKTPVISIVITGMVIFLSLLLPLEILVKTASTVVLTSYILTNIVVIVMRESKITNYKPSFSTPLYPWLQSGAVVIFTYFIIDLGRTAIELSLALLFISFCIYFFYGKRVKNREFALLHLLKRIADKGLTENIIEDELREIIVSRDDIEQDNFDKLIKSAKIIDIDKEANFSEMLDLLTPTISKEIDMTESEVKSRFIKRQEESDTAISEFLAIPHIVIEGEGKMFLTIVRSKNGIKFTESTNKVKAVFLLVGTKEKRALHLKTLASIGALVSEKDFQEHWMSVDSIIEMKNLMILSNRKRYY